MTIPDPLVPPSPETAPPATPHSAPSWWRRNRLGLVAVAVLLPATVFAVGWQNWHLIYDFGARPVDPIVVADGDSAELGGGTFGPVRSAVIEDLSGLDVPEGAKVIAAAVPVDAGADGVSCRRPTLTHQASGRQWELKRAEIGVPDNEDEPELCFTDELGSYELIAPFVVPDDVEGPFWLDVWPSESGGTFLRFPIDP
ncbi:hypothetical protein [Streptomyces sp. AC495_CC817]|uniref:hypothetical protein n=1 Tax=Streptomyces sp. AC495_CC817 TaxID=2823900 RepID=UPI001C26DA25|nr:hypothetical protein [Streptomyces sp. AC495_CC817]